METSIIFVFLSIFNIISAVLAAITAYLYFWLPVTQNSHGTCVFHFSLNIALMHAVLTLVKSGSKISYFIQEHCMTEAYVFCFLVATVHVWSVILSYSTWNEVNGYGLTLVLHFLSSKDVLVVKKQAKFVNHMYPTTRLIYYRFFGYSVPTLYVAFVIFFVHYVFHNDPKPDSICFSHMEYIQALPSLGSIFLNIFFFNDSQRRLSRLFTDVTEVQNENSPSRSFKTKLKYKKRLNLKLCLTMSIPFGLSSIMSVIVESIIVRNTESYLLKLLELTHFFLTSLQGTSIFLVAVVFREVVIKSFIKNRHGSYLSSVRVPKYLTKRATNDDVEETADESGILYDEERVAGT